jgi:hypothetical protein
MPARFRGIAVAAQRKRPRPYVAQSKGRGTSDRIRHGFCHWAVAPIASLRIRSKADPQPRQLAAGASRAATASSRIWYKPEIAGFGKALRSCGKIRTPQGMRRLSAPDLISATRQWAHSLGSPSRRAANRDRATARLMRVGNRQSRQSRPGGRTPVICPSGCIA